jgi:hypothetical protein
MARMETTTPSEDVLLEVLRATRWEVTGGKGTAPDLTDVRGDCLEEIAAEFFEGEPGTFHKGKALVRFGASRERMFFVSELFTEYDPFARTWKTFHISRHGTDALYRGLQTGRERSGRVRAAHFSRFGKERRCTLHRDLVRSPDPDIFSANSPLERTCYMRL